MKTQKIFAALSLIGAIGAGSIGAGAPLRRPRRSRLTCLARSFGMRATRYTRNGYCFNTDRARSVFGGGCFPPYGRLSGWEKSYVNQLQMWERRKGC
jgi:hypothetical protein